MRLSPLALPMVLVLAGCRAPEPVAPTANPAPQQHFAVEAWTSGTPMPPASAVAFVDMVIADTACVPRGLLSGLPAVPVAQRVAVVMQRGEDGRFRGEVARDPLLAQDLYGRGLCVWRASAVGVEFRDTAHRYALTGSFETPPAQGRRMMGLAAIHVGQWSDTAPVEGDPRKLPLAAPGAIELRLRPGEAVEPHEVLTAHPAPGFAHVAMLVSEN